MGKDDKEDSGFGFKDKAKAVETLRLLEAHELNYRRLTVRGLLGRAKRVLSLTKAEDKIKNIKEAMEVFENWLADLDKNKDKKPEKKDKKSDKKDKEDKMDVDDEESGSDDDRANLPSESVPGLGFKDREAAEASIKVLEGRDPDYQLLAVKGLIGRAKRVLTCTRDESKLSNIKEAISVLDQFVDEFDNKHLSRENCPYLSVGYVRTAHTLAGAGDTVSQQQKSFLSAYESVKGEYKRLRNVPEKDGGQTWDIVRNNVLKDLKQKYKDSKLFNGKGEPTKEHVDYILWAYSPEPAQLKKVIQYTKEEDHSENNSEKADNKTDKADNKTEKADNKTEKKEKAEKRRRSSSDDESPSKKKK